MENSTAFAKIFLKHNSLDEYTIQNFLVFLRETVAKRHLELDQFASKNSDKTPSLRMKEIILKLEETPHKVTLEETSFIEDCLSILNEPSIQPFGSTDITRKVFALLEKAKTVAENTGIKIPEIVVFGSQSSGKSSVLQRLVDVKFLPVDNDTCTTCPIKVIVEKNEDPVMKFEVWIGAGKKFTPKKIKGDAPWIYDEEAIKQVISECMEAKCPNNANLKKQAGKDTKNIPDYDISAEEMIVKITGSKISVNLTLVDLPGMVGTRAPKMHAAIKGIMETYASKRSITDGVLFIHCVAGNQEWAKSQVDMETNILETMKGHSNNMIGIVTRVDQDQTRYKWSTTMYETELKQCGAVFYLKNKIDGQDAPSDEINRSETEFFKSNSKSFNIKSGKENECSGIEALRVCVHDRFMSIAFSTIMNMRKEIQKLLVENKKEIDELCVINALKDIEDPQEIFANETFKQKLNSMIMGKCEVIFRLRNANAKEKVKVKDTTVLHHRQMVKSLFDQIKTLKCILPTEKDINDNLASRGSRQKSLGKYAAAEYFDELCKTNDDQLHNVCRKWKDDFCENFFFLIKKELGEPNSTRFERTFHRVVCESWKEDRMGHLDCLFDYLLEGLSHHITLEDLDDSLIIEDSKKQTNQGVNDITLLKNRVNNVFNKSKDIVALAVARYVDYYTWCTTLDLFHSEVQKEPEFLEVLKNDTWYKELAEALIPDQETWRKAKELHRKDDSLNALAKISDAIIGELSPYSRKFSLSYLKK
jgi:GTP-binding protein EngB required for normal cell division